MAVVDHRSDLMRCISCGAASIRGVCKNCYRDLFDGSPERVSFAFSSEVPDISTLSNTEVLDLFFNPISKFHCRDFQALTILRLSHCQNLLSVRISNFPKLKGLDLSGCPSLSECTIDECASIRAFDASFCSELSSINGDFKQIEYFSIPSTKISTLPQLLSAKFIDISNTNITDLAPLQSCAHLQVLHASPVSFDIGQFSRLNELTAIDVQAETVSLTSFPPPSLRTLVIKALHASIPSMSNVDIMLNGNAAQENSFRSPKFQGDWHSAHRLLYGPFPIPPCDALPPSDVPICFPLPQSMDKEIAANQILGCIIGTAIGDCCGLHAEREGRLYTNAFLDNPLDITWTHPKMTKRGLQFHRGTYTDDTMLMQMFIRSIVETKGAFDVRNAGHKIKEWIDHGITEHLDGIGIGQGSSTAGVVHSVGFDEDPIKASVNWWEKGRRRSCGNGGVMRTGSVGCFRFWEENVVINNAYLYCKITHADPRALFGSVLISLLISRLIQWRCGGKEVNIDSTISDAIQAVPELTKENISEMTPFLFAKSFDDLKLEDKTVAHSVSTMGCGVYALRKGFRFADGIEAVIRSGGDTDTNAAVVGAILGAKWGLDEIPLSLIQYLFYIGSMKKDAVPFMKLMGLEFNIPGPDEQKKFVFEDSKSEFENSRSI